MEPVRDVFDKLDFYEKKKQHVKFSEPIEFQPQEVRNMFFNVIRHL